MTSIKIHVALLQFTDSSVYFKGSYRAKRSELMNLPWSHVMPRGNTVVGAGGGGGGLSRIRLLDRRLQQLSTTVRKISGDSYHQPHLSVCSVQAHIHFWHDLSSKTNAARSVLGLDYQCSLLCVFCLGFRLTDNLST